MMAVNSNSNSNPFEAKRGCTNCFWLLVFTIFWAGMGLIAWQSIINGRPDILMYVPYIFIAVVVGSLFDVDV